MTMPDGNFGNLISMKDDRPLCMRYQERLDDKDLVRELGSSQIAYMRERTVDSNDLCMCIPDAPGVIWSQVMSKFGKRGPQSYKPIDMSRRARKWADDDLMECAAEGAELYNEYMKRFFDIEDASM